MTNLKRTAAVAIAISILFVVSVANVAADGNWNDIEQASQENIRARENVNSTQDQVNQYTVKITDLKMKIKQRTVEIQNQVRSTDATTQEGRDQIKRLRGEESDYRKEVNKEIREEQKRMRESIKALGAARREFNRYNRELKRQCSQVKPRVFMADLNGREEVPPVDTKARGVAVFVLNNDCTSMQYLVAPNNIIDTTEAHLHLGAFGQNGPVIAPLFEGPVKSGKFSGRLSKGVIRADDLTGPMGGKKMSDLVESMKAGDVYANVHTQSHPDGEIRGQVHEPGKKVPKPNVTFTPGPTATYTPQPTYTSTPTPGSKTITLNWRLKGDNGDAQKDARVPRGLIKKTESITLTYNLNGLCLLDGDASAVILEQDGWKYVSLKNYGQNCYNGEQTVTIPITDFQGLDRNRELTGSFRMRIWYGSAFEVNVKSVTFNTGAIPSPTGTPMPTYTPGPTVTPQPTYTSTPTPGPTQGPDEMMLNWRLQGNNGDAQAYKDVPRNILNGRNSITLKYDLHGTCISGADASAIIFDQDQWRYASLSNYGQNCYNGEQVVTIPLSHFWDLNPNADLTGPMHARFWSNSSFDVEIKSVKFNS